MSAGSGSKTKKLVAECRKCGCHILTKDTQRHEAVCGNLDDKEVSILQPSGIFRGYAQHVDKFNDYLAPDATGWSRSYTALVNPSTLNLWGIAARQPCFMDTSAGRCIVITWPCKEVIMMRIASRFAPKEKLCELRPIAEYALVSRLGIQLEKHSSLPLDQSLQDYLEAYLSNAYVQEGCSISATYYGQKVQLLPQTPLEQLMEGTSIDEGLAKSKPVLCVASACSLLLEIPFVDDLADDLGEKVDPFEKIGGCKAVKELLHDYVIGPRLSGAACCSLLIWGLPGSGKTLLLDAVLSLLGSAAVKVSSLDELIEKAPILTPQTVLLLDVNSFPKEHKAYQLLPNLMTQNKVACVVLSARNADDVELGVRVRFPLEIEVPVPNEAERVDILGVLTGEQPPPTELVELAKRTHGFTGGDLESLVRAAWYAKGETMAAKLEAARRRVRPTGIRQFILEVPDIRFDHIGGNDELKLEIQQAVLWPQRYPEAFTRFGIDPPAGILLYGPPGCSKTLVARALANESKMNFLAVKGPELFSKWVGESEKAIRDLFARARQVAPTIVFFDEIDAVGQSRGATGSSVGDRVLAQLLTELDGLEKQAGVVLLAATNRPDQLDAALLRPGRLDRAIYVGLPCPSTRRAILEMRLRKMAVSENVSIDELVDRTEGYSGAELVALSRTAALIAMREDIHAPAVERRHFDAALQTIVPRTDKKLLEIYEKFSKGNVV